MACLQTINFTIPALDKLTWPTKGFDTYKDAKCIYLYLYVTAKGIKTFFVRTRFKGRDERIIIGRFPIISIEQARKKAILFLAMVTEGNHPHEEKRKQAETRLTFGQHFEEYLERYSKPHKKTWAEDKRDIEKYVPHWFRREMSDIKKPEVQKLHEKIFAENGPAQANKILVRVRAIFNKAIEWGWQGSNPTVGIKKYKERSRDRFVQPHEMPFLIHALNEVSSETLRDFFAMLFLTGARKTNMMMMRWEEINWESLLWRIPVTKNGDPVVVPLVPRAVEILRRRFSKAKSEWVFPQEKERKKHISDPKEEWTRTLARATLHRWRNNEATALWMETAEKDTSITDDKAKLKLIVKKAKKENIILPSPLTDIHLHDIRRTFGSYQALTGASLLTIGKSLGHKSTEVTQVYARLNTDTVRASIEKATDAMFH